MLCFGSLPCYLPPPPPEPNLKQLPYLSARFSPQPGETEDATVAMIARALHALFGVHGHPFPVDFVVAFKLLLSSNRDYGVASLPLWSLSCTIMDSVVHKREMSRATQLQAKKEFVQGAFKKVTKQFLAQPERFGLFLSRFLHHLLAEWMGAASAKSVSQELLALMQRLLLCSLIEWEAFYNRTQRKDIAALNDASSFCHCLDHLSSTDAATDSAIHDVRQCSFLYGFGGDHKTLFHHCFLLHPAIMGSLHTRLAEAVTIDMLHQDVGSRLYSITCNDARQSMCYLDMYCLLRRRSNRYTSVLLHRPPQRARWWHLRPVLETPEPSPATFS